MYIHVSPTQKPNQLLINHMVDRPVLSKTYTCWSISVIVFCSIPSSQNFLNSSRLQWSKFLQENRLSLMLDTFSLDSKNNVSYIYTQSWRWWIWLYQFWCTILVNSCQSYNIESIEIPAPHLIEWQLQGHI